MTPPLFHHFRRAVLRRLHEWGYGLWCWTDDRMADDQERLG